MLITQLLPIAKRAANAIMAIYQQPFEIEIKADNSPLTLADRESNDIITQELTNIFPNIPIISEENKLIEYNIRKNWTKCWLVDPLDGTKEFVKRNGEFTINIALIENQIPIAGLIYVPAQQQGYFAQQGSGAFKIDSSDKIIPITIAKLDPTKPLKIVASRSHPSPETTHYIETLQQEHAAGIEYISAGSALKFCLVAQGDAHCYPRFAPTMEWDTAAGHIIATEAGANLAIYPQATPLTYNRPNLLNPYFLLKTW